jgi:hypothetical protein
VPVALGNLYNDALHRFEEAVDYLRRGHSIGSTQPGWQYDSSAWLASAESNLEAARLLGAGEFEREGNLLSLLRLGHAAVARGEPERALSFFGDAFDLAGVDGIGPGETRWALDSALIVANPWIGEEPSPRADEVLLETAEWLRAFAELAGKLYGAQDTANHAQGRIHVTRDERRQTCRLLSSPLLRRAREEGLNPSLRAEVQEAWARAWEQVAKLEEIAAR